MNMAEFGLTSLTFVDRTSPVKLNSPHIEHFLGVQISRGCYADAKVSWMVARVLLCSC